MNRNAITVNATVLATVRQRNLSRRAAGAAASSLPTNWVRTSATHPRASRMADQPQGASAIGWRMATIAASSFGL